MYDSKCITHCNCIIHLSLRLEINKIRYSFFRNQPEICEILLGKGASINAVNKGGCSTLHVAVNKQQVKCVKTLLHHKCDVNIQVFNLAYTCSFIITKCLMRKG